MSHPPAGTVNPPNTLDGGTACQQRELRAERSFVFTKKQQPVGRQAIEWVGSLFGPQNQHWVQPLPQLLFPGKQASRTRPFGGVVAPVWPANACPPWPEKSDAVRGHGERFSCGTCGAPKAKPCSDTNLKNDFSHIMLQVTCVPLIISLPVDIICDSFDLVVVQWNRETQTLRRACGTQKVFARVSKLEIRLASFFNAPPSLPAHNRAMNSDANFGGCI